MKGQRILTSLAVLAALLVAMAGLSQASGPQEAVASRAAISNVFTYAAPMVGASADCPAPARMFPGGEDSYVCPPPVKSPYPPPRR